MSPNPSSNCRPLLPDVPAPVIHPAPSGAEIDRQFAECRRRYQRGHGLFTLDDLGDTFLFFSTRESGDIGEGTPGEADLAAGREFASSLRKSFPALRIYMEPVDEWVHVAVHRAAPLPPPQPPYPEAFWRQVFDFLVANLAGAGIAFVEEPELILSSGRNPTFRFPVRPYTSGAKSDWAAVIAQNARVQRVFDEACRGTPFSQITHSYLSVGKEIAGIDLAGLPPWAKRNLPIGR